MSQDNATRRAVSRARRLRSGSRSALLSAHGRASVPWARALGAVIRAKRQTLEWSLAALAASAGMTSTNLSEYELGTRLIQLPRLERIAAALGCRASHLVADAEAIMAIPEAAK